MSGRGGSVGGGGVVSGGVVAGGIVAGGLVAGGAVAGAVVAGGFVAGGVVAGGAVGGGAVVVVVLVAWLSWANSSSAEKTSPLDASAEVPAVVVDCGAAEVEVVVELGVVGRGGASDVAAPVVLVGEVDVGAASAAEAGAGSLLMKPPTTPAVPRALMAPTIRLARLAGWRRAEKGFI